MKVWVCYTVDVDDEFRRAINEWYGLSGLAGRAEVHRWYEENGHSMDDDMPGSLQTKVVFGRAGSFFSPAVPAKVSTGRSVWFEKPEVAS